MNLFIRVVGALVIVVGLVYLAIIDTKTGLFTIVVGVGIYGFAEYLRRKQS